MLIFDWLQDNRKDDELSTVVSLCSGWGCGALRAPHVQRATEIYSKILKFFWIFRANFRLRKSCGCSFRFELGLIAGRQSYRTVVK